MAFEPSVGHLSWHHGLANAHFAVMIFQAIALIKKQHNYCKPWIRSADVWWLLQFTVSFQWWYYLLWTNNVHGRSLIILASFDCIDKPTTLNRDIVLWGNGSKYDKPTWCIFLQSTERRVEVKCKGTYGTFDPGLDLRCPFGRRFLSRINIKCDHRGFGCVESLIYHNISTYYICYHIHTYIYIISYNM